MKEQLFRLRPTIALGGLFFMLAAIWYSAASQGNSAAYLLLFALTAMFLVSIPQTILNLAHLTPTVESLTPTFAGQELSIPVEIMNQARASCHGVKVSVRGGSKAEGRVDTIPAGEAARLTLTIPAKQRGEHVIGHLRLSTVYPLGLLRTARQYAVPQHYIVYPAPRGDATLPAQRDFSHQGERQGRIGEGDEFAGVRSYVSGESQRHIDWKAVARGQPLMSKQFTSEMDDELLLDFASVPLAEVEARLSQLALWVVEAERTGCRYGLRLPGGEIPPSLGESHFHRCLRALALFS